MNYDYRKIFTTIITLSFLIVLPLLTLYVSELIVRETLSMTFSEWVEGYSKRFILNVILLLALFNILYILPRKLFMLASLLLSGILIFFAYANAIKIDVRNSPISMGDFALLNELRGLDNPIDLNLPLLIGACVGVVAVIAAIFLAIPKLKENWIIKSILFTLSLSFLAVFWTDYPVSPMEKAQFQNTWWQQEVGTMRNGLFGNFVMLAKQTQLEPPENYSKEKIRTIDQEYQAEVRASEEKPNVIFLMSEAFVDPYYFGEEHYLEDPIPNFRKLFGESLHGNMYSSEFGGGTANVEFEALTGLSRQFIPDNYVAYQLYVKKPLPSVATQFKQAGYETTAIHTYLSWYYQRNVVYRLLGFDQFIPGEFIDLDHELGSGWGFPKDKHITNTVLDSLNNTEGRDFVHAVATEGHQPYRLLEDSAFLKKGTMPDVTRQYLNMYAEKMNSIDKELGRLVEELKKREEPSILFFFGDHYPTFGNNDQVYGAEGTNVAPNMLGNYEDFISTHEVPYFVWKSEDNQPEELDVSPNQFAALALEMAGVTGNKVTAILDDMRAKGDTVMPYNQWQEQMGEQTTEAKDLQILQYDLLHGNRYAEKMIPGLIGVPNKDYHLGLYPTMEIEKIEETANQFEVYVQGAPKYAELVGDGNEEILMDWKRIEQGLASFTVNKKDVDSKGIYNIAVFDSLENILRQTDEFKFQPSE